MIEWDAMAKKLPLINSGLISCGLSIISEDPVVTAFSRHLVYKLLMYYLFTFCPL